MNLVEKDNEITTKTRIIYESSFYGTFSALRSMIFYRNGVFPLQGSGGGHGVCRSLSCGFSHRCWLRVLSQPLIWFVLKVLSKITFFLVFLRYIYMCFNERRLISIELPKLHCRLSQRWDLWPLCLSSSSQLSLFSRREFKSIRTTNNGRRNWCEDNSSVLSYLICSW